MSRSVQSWRGRREPQRIWDLRLDRKGIKVDRKEERSENITNDKNEREKKEHKEQHK